MGARRLEGWGRGTEIASAIMIAICGFWWGEWYAERKAERNKGKGDVGLILIARMADQLLKSRKFTGSPIQLTASHHIPVNGNDFTLSLRLEADGELSALNEGTQ